MNKKSFILGMLGFLMVIFLITIIPPAIITFVDGIFEEKPVKQHSLQPPKINSTTVTDTFRLSAPEVIE